MLKTLNSLLGTVLGLCVVALVAFAGYLGYQTYFADKFALEETEATLAKRDEEIKSLSLDLAARGQELDQSRQQIGTLTRDVEEKTEKIRNLNQDLIQKAEQIQLLNVQVTEQAQQIVALNKDLEAKQREIEQLSLAMRLLKVDHRVAQIDVLSQEGSAGDGDLVTTVSFSEVGAQGKPLDEPRIFQIQGDVIYISSLVVKFTDQNVELGDPLRSTSVCLFQKIFGESQQPREGFALDAEGSQPAAYRSGGNMSDFEREIWGKFWDYANDPALAEKAGVRAAHGEAPFQKILAGKRYKLLLRASGGLTIVPEDLQQPSIGEAL